MDEKKKQAIRTELYKKNNLNADLIPKHIAIIMDGNGRWAKKRLLPRTFGHKAGAEAVRKTIKACVELNIKYLTLYVFSTENWKRPKEEVGFLMGFLRELIKKEVNGLEKEGARLRILGDNSMLSPELLTDIQFAENKTAHCDTLNINLMINYGGRFEILNACKNLLKEKIDPGKLTEEIFEQHLYTKDSPELDLLIRTGGDNIRLSNFLLWQVAYSEMFFLETLWPDFDKKTLIKILQKFQLRDRKFGGLSTQPHVS
ncbi:MAG: polyprenyl diphosphate synthase [Candidatus Margulisiibacteriota bacterium]|jgi:undecaprenyl diphosphate synthase